LHLVQFQDAFAGFAGECSSTGVRIKFAFWTLNPHQIEVFGRYIKLMVTIPLDTGSQAPQIFKSRDMVACECSRLFTMGFSMKKMVLAVAVSLSVAGFSGYAQAGEQLALEQQALESLFPGHYEARVAGGYRMLIAAKDDGTMMGRAFGKEDKGQWVIRDEELCIAWSSWTRGKYKCGSITQNGDWFVATNSEDGEKMKFKAVDRREVYAARIGRKAARD